MSEGKRWHIDEARAVAGRLVTQLEFYCDRIEIVGSVRRTRRSVGDVELLMIPRIDQRQVDMFTKEPVDLAAERIESLLQTGFLAKRKAITGHDAGWGAKNKLAVFTENGMPVDLFLTTAENWWVSLVIRTGGKQNNLNLTQAALRRGRSLNAYGCGVTDKMSGEVITAHSEQDVFKLCGVKYLEPCQRP